MTLVPLLTQAAACNVRELLGAHKPIGSDNRLAASTDALLRQQRGGVHAANPAKLWGLATEYLELELGVHHLASA